MGRKTRGKQKKRKEMRGTMIGIHKDSRVASTNLFCALHMLRDKHQNKIGYWHQNILRKRIRVM